jgi:carbon starvation protein
MFDALFILTTLDAGTRVGRYLLQDALGRFWKPLADVRNAGANVLASGSMVAAWGFFLIQGVRDPLGGINSLWPLFGIANQLLATIALCLATTVILKMALQKNGTSTSRSSPRFALITLVPLIWLLAVTLTAGTQKIFHPDPRVGFLAAAKVYSAKIAEAREAVKAGKPEAAAETATKALAANQRLLFNNLLDAIVAGVFLVLALSIVVISAREWLLLLRRNRPATLYESEAVWLPEYAVAESRRAGLLGFLAIGLALIREWSGETMIERAQRSAANSDTQQAMQCRVQVRTDRQTSEAQRRKQLYVESVEQRFRGVNRCC